MMRVDLVRFDHITPKYLARNLQETNVWPGKTISSGVLWSVRKDLLVRSFPAKAIKKTRNTVTETPSPSIVSRLLGSY
jgi:hypothetical protein